MITMTINKPWKNERKKMEQLYQSQPTDLTFWAHWNFFYELLFPERSTWIIDCSKNATILSSFCVTVCKRHSKMNLSQDPWFWPLLWSSRGWKVNMDCQQFELQTNNPTQSNLIDNDNFFFCALWTSEKLPTNQSSIFKHRIAQESTYKILYC